MNVHAIRDRRALVARRRQPADNGRHLNNGRHARPAPAPGFPFDLEKLIVVKQIIAIIKPYLAEKVLDALRRAPLEACSVREVKGYGRQKSYLDQYGDSEYSLAFLPKVEITLWVDDARVGEILRKIVAVARTGRMGDGKIMVLPVADAEVIIDIGADATEAIGKN